MSPQTSMESEMVSFLRFCEWVQGKRAIREEDIEDGEDASLCATCVDFEDGSSATFYSNRIAPEAGGNLEPPSVIIEWIEEHP